MFGSKKAKQARLKKIAGLVETQPHTLTEKELARAMIFRISGSWYRNLRTSVQCRR